MIRAPFIRLALLALCSLYVLGLALVFMFVGPWWALGVAAGGTALAPALSLSVEGEKPRRVTTRMK